MAIYRLQCSFGADTTFPRDRMVITPHFSTSLPGADTQQLCDDLAAGLNTWVTAGQREIVVRAYDAQGTKPVLPVGEKILNSGVTPGSAVPRELALCLSFRGNQNVPRKRGRLYIPATFLASGVGLRPAGTHQTKVASLVPIFTGLGGVDVDWCVFSRTGNQAYSVQHWWVDDEWDIQRKRGLRPTSRQSGDVSE